MIAASRTSRFCDSLVLRVRYHLQRVLKKGHRWTRIENNCVVGVHLRLSVFFSILPSKSAGAPTMRATKVEIERGSEEWARSISFAVRGNCFRVAVFGWKKASITTKVYQRVSFCSENRTGIVERPFTGAASAVARSGDVDDIKVMPPRARFIHDCFPGVGYGKQCA